MEETGLSGILDLKSGQSSKGSKLESALDKLGLQKRKVIEYYNEIFFEFKINQIIKNFFMNFFKINL